MKLKVYHKEWEVNAFIAGWCTAIMGGICFGALVARYMMGVCR